MEKAKQNTRWD